MAVAGRVTVTYSNWESQKPGANDRCAAMLINSQKRSFTWYDISCSTSLHVICQSDVFTMAASNVMNQVEEILTCAICLEILETPRALKCLHSFCATCLDSLGTNQQPPAYLCPQCRQTTLKTEVRSLHLVVQLLDIYKAANSASSELLCESCHKNSTRWRCMECKKQCLLCDTCKESHDNLLSRMDNDHQVLLLKELRQNTCVIDHPIYCEMHPKHTLEVYCMQCELVVCVLCKVLKHDGHGVQAIPEALANIKPKLDGYLQQLTQKIQQHKDFIATRKKQETDRMSQFDQDELKADRKLETEIKRLRQNHQKRRQEIASMRKQEQETADKELKGREDQMSGDVYLKKYATTVTEKSSGACLLTELSNNVMGKIKARVNEGYMIQQYPQQLSNIRGQRKPQYNYGYNC